MNIIIIATSDSEHFFRSHVLIYHTVVLISTQIIEQFCSDDSLKCYHYSVEIQKNLDGEGAHPPPQTPPPARRCAPRRSSFGRSFTGPPKPKTKSPPMAPGDLFLHWLSPIQVGYYWGFDGA